MRNWSKCSIYTTSINTHVTHEQTEVKKNNSPKLLACDREGDWNSGSQTLGSVLIAIILCCLSQRPFHLQRDNTKARRVEARSRAEP